MKFLPFIWRQLARNKIRTLLTAGAIALAVALVCLLLTMPAGMDAMLKRLASNTRVVVINKAGITYQLPYSYLQKIRAMPGVVAAASWTWYGGAFQIEKGVSFPNFAVEPDAVGEVWADFKIDPQQLESFRRHRNGAVVGRGTLNENHWKVGDQVSLRGTAWPVDLSFEIVGEIPNDRSPVFWLQREYLDQALRAAGRPGLDNLGIIWVRVDDAARVEPLMREIDETFHNSETQTASETEKSFFRSQFQVLEGLALLITIVTALLAVCIVFVAANTASMTVRERMREIAILKAIGFTRRQVFGILIGETVLLATIAGAIGAGASLGLSQLARAMSSGWNQQTGPLTWFIVTNAILVEGLFLAFFVGLISGIVPALGASRRGVAQTLREVF